jgi:hypothetical protein
MMSSDQPPVLRESQLTEKDLKEGHEHGVDIRSADAAVMDRDFDIVGLERLGSKVDHFELVVLLRVMDGVGCAHGRFQSR